jgi:predicted dehydrogenase
MQMPNGKVNWGIIGPGKIARAFAAGLLHSNTGELVAIATRNPTRPELRRQFPGTRIHHGYEALLIDPEVEAVYIATPHPSHAHWAIACAKAGKHVLCEKPMGLNEQQVQSIFDVAQKTNTFMGEALMYRAHPQTNHMLDLLKAGIIGDIRIIKSSFGYALPHNTASHRVFAPTEAGGGIMDVGVYPISMARLIAGIPEGKPYAEPIDVLGVAHLGETGVDEWASAVLKFSSGIVAEVSCSVSVQQDNILRIYGTTGRMEIADFWFATGQEGGQANIEVYYNDGSRRTEAFEEMGWLYSFEADAVGHCIQNQQQHFSTPAPDWLDTLGSIRVLDKWRDNVGLEFDEN